MSSGGAHTADPYEKASYRQKGKKANGSLIKGATSSAFIKKGVGAVPSKYETIVYLHADSRKKGFGSNSERFTGMYSTGASGTGGGVDPEDMPGPGSYTSETLLNQILKNSESHSKKGFGNGFISKSDRFKAHEHFY